MRAELTGRVGKRICCKCGTLSQKELGSSPERNTRMFTRATRTHTHKRCSPPLWAPGRPRRNFFGQDILLSLLSLFVALGAAGCLSIAPDPDTPPPTSPGGPPAPTTPGVTFPPAVSTPDAGTPPPQEAGPPPSDAPQILSFSATPEQVSFLATSTLSWHSENTENCRISPEVGAVPLSGSVTVSGGEPDTSRTFVLQCERAGVSARAEVRVETRNVVHTGDLVVRNTSELVSLTGINVVTGDLSILNASGFFDVSAWQTLVEVRGSLSFRNTSSLNNITLPYLRRVGNDLAIDDLASLSMLSLPELSEIGDRLYVSRTPALNPLSVQALVQQLQANDGIGGAKLIYQNNPAEILGSMQQGFDCIASDSGQPFYMLLYNGTVSGGDIYLENSLDTSASAQGTYAVQGDAIIIQMPGSPSETTSPLEFEYDHAVTFSSPSFALCHSIETGLDDGVSQEQELACPQIQYPLGSGSEENRFWIRPHGQVEWQQTIRLTQQGNEAQTATRRGIYVFDGIWIHLAFGNNIMGNRFMSGTLSLDNTRLLLDELAPELGPCTPPG